MLKNIVGGIRMYHNAKTGRSTLLSPFKPLIPTGKKIQVFRLVIILYKRFQLVIVLVKILSASRKFTLDWFWMSLFPI